MVKRLSYPIAVATAVWCVIASVSACVDSDDAVIPALSRGSAPPAVLSDAPQRVTVAWVFRAGDCLTCQTPAHMLRRIQGRHPSRARLLMIEVGKPSELVTSFFRQERLNVELVNLDREEYSQSFGTSSLPALYVVKGGKILEAIPAGATERGPQRELAYQRIESAVTKLLVGSEASPGSGEPVISHKSERSSL